MGIFGLTTYVAEHSSELFQDHKLCNSSILIDGNAAASIIYSHYTKCIHAFGGDYDKFANCVIEFIELLRKCNVSPCFIFDGGYEKRKLKTVIERIKLNVAICSQFKKKYRESKCFPLLLRDVFKDILRSINIPVIQCDFEADQELVVLARLVNCPVISNDSDFYISDATYIPFSTLEFKAYRFNKKTNDKFYMRCKIFRVDDLLNKFGGLADKSLLPLMSCALGNDYIPPHTFKQFLGITHSSKLSARMEKIVKWLQDVISTDVAIDQLMACAPKKYRGNLRNIVKQLLNECNSKSSHLLEHIPESFHISCEVAEAMSNLTICENEENNQNVTTAEFEITPVIENDQNVTTAEFEITSEIENEQMVGVGDDNFCLGNDDIEVIDSYEYEIEEDVDEEPEDTGNTSNLNNSFILNTTISRNNLPDWIMRKFRLGLVSPSIANIHNFKRIFIPSQSEDYLSPPSHLIITPILQIVIAMVLGKERSTEVKCHARLRSTITGIYRLSPIFSTDCLEEVPTLEAIETMDSSIRRVILLKCLNIDENANLNWFPQEWKLFVIAILYWLNNSKIVNLNQTYIRSVVLCLIHLSIIDKKIGYTRTQPELNRLNNLEKRKQKESKNENSQAENSQKLFTDLNANELNTITQVLDLVSNKDCIIAASALLHYHHLDNNLLQNRKSFDTKLVHGFAQLQHCLQAVMLLNSVLDFPYQPCMIQNVFCGTFLYNFYNDMCKRKLADGYITRTMLSKATSIISLYRYLIKSLAHIVPSVAENGSSNVEKKKKKSKRRKHIDVPIIVKEKVTEEPEENFIDSENIYSMLSTSDCNC